MHTFCTGIQETISHRKKYCQHISGLACMIFPWKLIITRILSSVITKSEAYFLLSHHTEHLSAFAILQNKRCQLSPQHATRRSFSYLDVVLRTDEKINYKCYEEVETHLLKNML